MPRPRSSWRTGAALALALGLLALVAGACAPDRSKSLDTFANKGENAQAAAWFQQTLKGASDFLGAAFYLGATHAVAGREKEAIGAWEMALLSENPGAVYPVLVDALLRTGDGRMALEILDEAPAAWANDNERLKREAIAGTRNLRLVAVAATGTDVVDLKACEERAKNMRIRRLFALTTHAAHWFLEQGFRASEPAALPSRRQALYNWKRNSQVFLKRL